MKKIFLWGMIEANIPGLSVCEVVTRENKNIEFGILNKFTYRNEVELENAKNIWEILCLDYSNASKAILQLIKFIGLVNKNFKNKVHKKVQKRIEVNFYKDLVHTLETNSYHIVHVHFCSERNLQIINYLPKHFKVILSIWGSDLLNPGSFTPEFYLTQKESFKRADLITLQTLDMAQILYTKFGFCLKSKTIPCLFGITDKKFQKMDALLLNSHLKMQTNEKIKIIASYSAARGQQHLEVLTQFNKLPKNYRDKVELTWLLTYNDEDSEYIVDVVENIKEAHVESIIYRDYLLEEEVLEIINSSNVFLSLRESDAMNGAMLEALYLNKLVISGAWLPYGILKRNNIEYVEIESLSELKLVITELLEGKIKVPNNTEKVHNLFSMSSTKNKWIQIYNLI